MGAKSSRRTLVSGLWPIRSLKRSGNQYSEVYIKGPETQAIGRPVLGPYSATVLAKDGTTVLVGEAVISGSAPDYSNHVRAQVDIWMKKNGAR